MYNNDIFTPDAINIFTDASIKKLYSGETIGCAGCILVFGELIDKNIQEDYQIIRNTTSNNSEIKAVRLGIQNVLRYKNQYRKIRLFSDSQISIFGIRGRIFNWKYIEGTYIGTEGTPIKNQDIFLEIVYTILENNLNIEFYHQKGHVTYTPRSINDAMHVFIASNNIREYVDESFIKQISIFNNMVDNNSRNYLNNFDPSNEYLEPLYFKSALFNKRQYLNLIKRKDNYYE